MVAEDDTPGVCSSTLRRFGGVCSVSEDEIDESAEADNGSATAEADTADDVEEAESVALALALLVLAVG